MRRVRQELTLVIARRLQSLEHRVHRARQPSNLIVASRLAHAALQRGCRDVLHLSAHGLDGSQGPSGQEPGDQGDGEILCDYGAAYSFMLMLAGRYGTPFMTALHRNDGNGFAGLQAVLDQFAKDKAAAVENLKRPDQFKNNPEEKARLEQLVARRLTGEPLAWIVGQARPGAEPAGDRAVGGPQGFGVGHQAGVDAAVHLHHGREWVVGVERRHRLP